LIFLQIKIVVAERQDKKSGWRLGHKQKIKGAVERVLIKN